MSNKEISRSNSQLIIVRYYIFRLQKELSSNHLGIVSFMITLQICEHKTKYQFCHFKLIIK